MRLALVAPTDFDLPPMTDVEVARPAVRDIGGAIVDALLLHHAAFADLAALLAARATRASVPAMVLAPADQHEALLAMLGPHDDVVELNTSGAVLARRLSLLVLARAAERDGLTGLRTRQQFRTALEAALTSVTPEHPISVVFLDIDHFKRLNDERGHLAGDEVLKAVAARMVAALAPEDIAARIGGEEFAVLLRDGEEAARGAAEGLRQAVAALPVLDDAAVTVSIGVGTVTSPCATREPMRRAEEALYAAKASGRDRVVTWTELLEAAGGDDEVVSAQSFEHMTHVVAARVAEAITVRGRRVIEEMRAQADVDGLTRLFNRRYLDRRLPVEVDGARTRSEPLTVAMIDVDFFGQVNKTHGWPAGDAVLVELAARVRDAVRKDDWVARYGGEELCIVLRDTRPEDAAPILERVREAVRRTPFLTPGGESVPVTISIGAAGQQADDGPAALLSRVSDELLRAKRDGRDRVYVASPPRAPP